MNLPWYRWQTSSYMARLIGIGAAWGEESWLVKWSEILSAILIALVLLCAPLVSNSWTGVLLIAVAGFWGLLTIAEQKPYRSGPIERLVLIYWLIASLATAFSPVKSAAFAGWIKLTLYLVMFALAARVMRSHRLANVLITILLHVSLWVSIYGVRQEFFGAPPLATWNDPDSPLAQDTRVYSYLGNPNLLASYLLPAIALSLAAIVVWQGFGPKLLATTMTVINSACLYFTDSRGGWLGMFILLIVFFSCCYYWWYEKLTPWWRRWLIPLVLVMAVLAISLAFSQSESLRLRILSMFAGREDSSNNFRLNVWAAVLEMIQDYPWLGIGPGNRAFNQIYPLYMRPNYTALGAYSIFLEMTVEMGILGISCFLGLVALIVTRVVKNLQKLKSQQSLYGFWLIGAIAGLMGLLTHGLFDVVWYRPQVNTLWWFLVALIASYDWQD